MLAVWLDYRKAFDSAPHDWIIKALKLAKVPKNLVESIKRLTKQRATILNLCREDQSATSDEIHYTKGIFQGDSLSVLFILSVNPLSFMLGQLKGYSFGDDCKSEVTHNFFVDDLKLFAILEILQYFQYIKIYKAMESVGIALFHRICVSVAINTMRLLILEILCGDESLISIFHFLCKAIVPVYYSVYLPFFYQKKFCHAAYTSLSF